MKRILILTSGKKGMLRAFKPSRRNLNIDITIASFNDIYFNSESSDLFLKGGAKLTEFKVIYFRLVGKSLETAAVVAEYAKRKWIKIVDKIYVKSQVFPITQSKGQEMKSLADNHIAIPKTFFGSIGEIAKRGPSMFGFPFVVKSTSGRKGREVYSPKNKEALKKLIDSLVIEEKAGKKFFAQKFINCTKRIRVLVIGGRAIGAVSQLTKWRKRVSGYTPHEDEKKIEKFELDKSIEKLALKATRAVGLDIAGVDILEDEITKKHFVIEVNAAPSWKLIKKYCGVNVEYEILKFISK